MLCYIEPVEKLEAGYQDENKITHRVFLVLASFFSLESEMILDSSRDCIELGKSELTQTPVVYHYEMVVELLCPTRTQLNTVPRSV